ncbi:hypothetical protein [Salinicola halophilus]|uniref:hypothetical protein n=1 Tax=Salinicola halophilus TaxID=184065 RepID=UPI0013A683D3|nr:hypothetical protein [Salinicola halophilus]
MSDYNKLNEKKQNNVNDKSQNNEEQKTKKKVGFQHFAYYNLNKKEGYPMNITEYETKVRKQIFELKEKKKEEISDEDKKAVEKKIAKLKGDLISNADNAVFNYLMANIMFDNTVNMNHIEKTQSAIAKKLFLTRQSVSTAFNKLRRLHIISYSTQGNAFEWIRISPFVCWQGEATSHFYKMKEQRDFARRPFEQQHDILSKKKEAV